MPNAHSPAGPPWLIRLGHFLGCLPDKLGFLSQCVRSHGDVVDLSLASPLVTTFLVNHPDDIGHILLRHHQNYSKTPKLTSAAGRQRSGDGLLTGVGKPAVAQKRLLQPLLAEAAGPRFDRLIVDCTQQAMARWQPGGEIDVASEMASLARRIIGKALLSVDLENEGRELAAAIMVRQRYIRHVYETKLPFAERLPTRINRQCRQAVRFIDQTLYPMIAARRRDPAPPPDLLTMFINARYSDGSSMTDKQIRDEALTITSTGYETVALALAWTMYLLAEHPAAQRQLAEEVHAVLHGRAATAGDMPNLRYAAMVFSEAMRLYPPTWIFMRVPQQDDVLPTGVRVPAGARLYLCPYVTHRDPRFFPEPGQFQPERFAEASRQARHRFAYFPFAAGPRICLGQDFAMMEGILALACIAQRFTWDLAPGQIIEPKPGQFLFPRNGIRIRLKPANEDSAH